VKYNWHLAYKSTSAIYDSAVVVMAQDMLASYLPLLSKAPTRSAFPAMTALG
jgi:hypothetical protein